MKKLIFCYISVSVTETDFDPSTLHAEKRRLLRKNGPAIAFMPDDGSGQASIHGKNKTPH